MALGKPTLESFCNIPLKKLRADELTELNLYNKGIGVPGALVLSSLLPVSASLTELNLYDNTLMDEGCTSVCDALRKNKTCKLAKLNIGSNAIDVDGAKSAAAYMAISASLTSLDLYHNSIGDKGVMSLAEALRVNASLTSLDLSRNDIGAEGALSLAAIRAVDIRLTLSCWY